LETWFGCNGATCDFCFLGEAIGSKVLAKDKLPAKAGFFPDKGLPIAEREQYLGFEKPFPNLSGESNFVQNATFQSLRPNFVGADNFQSEEQFLSDHYKMYWIQLNYAWG